MGDFNLPVARWGDPYNSHPGRDLYTNLLESDLYQHIKNPTRENNILDIILATTDNLVSEFHSTPINITEQ